MKKEFELYQDEEGNVYDITTDLEQLIIQDLYKAMKRNNEKQDEIERLQKQKEELQINGLRQETLFKLEIERLNKELEIEKDISDGMLETIEKAKDYIKEHIRIDDEYPDYMEMLLEEYKELLEILKGEQ